MSTTTKVLFRLLLVAIALPIPQLLFADCPEGVRPTTAAEQSEYLALLPVLRNALPASPAGLQVKADPLFTTAPNSVCKGSPLVASYGATYTFTDQADRNQASAREHEARIQALQKLSPEEQKQADDLYHQGSQLGYRSIAEQKNHNQAEADRLRHEEIGTAHLLLGLLQDEGSLAGAILHDSGLSLDAVRRNVDDLRNEEPGPTP